MPNVEKMKAYHDKWAHDDLMKARGDGIVIDQGEAWRYEFSHQDALGHYDLWYRPEDPLAPNEDNRSLRDWFAGQALASVGTWMPAHGGSDLGSKAAMQARALWAYEQADAMIAERAKDGGYA